LWLKVFHKLMLYQLFTESPIFSDGHDGIPESLLAIHQNPLKNHDV
jgi:hypothetical protein